MTGEPQNLYLYIFVAGFAATYVWRFVGVIFAERVQADSEMLVWVRLVATALMAALVARIVFFPPGALEDTMLSSRLAGMIVGVLVYLFAGRMLSLGVTSAALIFLTFEVVRAGF